VATREVGNKVIFLRKLVPGGSKHSFGIHVAQMAGMPKAIVQRANEILHQLEAKSLDKENLSDVIPPSTSNLQLSIFETSDPAIAKIKEAFQHLDINSMTPIECMMKLNELASLLEE